MKRLMTIIVLIGPLALAQPANAGFYAFTNEIGYQGTVWNMTSGTGPWTVGPGRNAVLAIGDDFPNNFQFLQSNWTQHAASNTYESFLLLADGSCESVTSATGGWDETQKVFTLTVDGANAPLSRMWQPENWALHVTFIDYTYTFTATFSSTASINSDGWFVNSVTPDSITGSFAGHSIVADDVAMNPVTNSDTYGFDIAFSKALFSPLDNGGTPYSYFEEVPEPAMLVLLGLGAFVLRRRR
jgi:hypothetical protein